MATPMTTTPRRLSPARIIFRTPFERQKFYDPPERGFEREIRKRLEYWEKLRKDPQRGRS